ncbi:hypothetical protein CANARDRAFT_21255 [[Candida] arabinofermentans NRRL YB-2248]|uniref:Enoyl reductase (ER) domain-containing protein n=1 Tax=[Candida] arabinofermentans NRRL YB-2248 TaxID=983967 RepID=A0A1E4T6B0_9ASCO|nr:hypothetical protein CANARDRAFT_21255 [[Candida] arabinofermentans NRRL YB-2248]
MSLPELPTVVDNKITVKAITYQNYSTPPKLTTIQYDVPSSTTLIGPDEVLVKNKAVSINPVDIILASFALKVFKGSSDKVMGGDFSGIVAQVGSNITDFKIGDRVVGNCLKIFGVKAAFQDFVIVDAKKDNLLSKVPEGMSFVEAAALPIASGTAFQLITEHRNLKGSNVLIFGAGSSVGSYGIQFAKHYYGAKNVVVTCSPRSSQRSLDYGADKVVDYTKGNSNELKEILQIVKEIGKFDLVLDTVRDTSILNNLSDVLKTRKEGGIYAQVGGLATCNYENPSMFQTIPTLKTLSEMFKSMIGLSKFDVHTASLNSSTNKAWEKAVAQLWSEGKFKIPLASKVFKFETEYTEAIQTVAKSSGGGKVVMEL